MKNCSVSRMSVAITKTSENVMPILLGQFITYNRDSNSTLIEQ